MVAISAMNPPRRVQFEARYEINAMTEWDNVEHQAGAPDPVASADHARTGTYSQKSVCNGANNYRSEASHQVRRWMAARGGEERFYGFSVYLVDPWPDNAAAFTFCSIAQWHQDNATPGSPPLSISVNPDPAIGVGERGKISIGGGLGGALNYPAWHQVIMDTATNVWIDLVVWVLWSATVGAGKVKVWMNGAVAVNTYTIPSTPTIYPDAGALSQAYPKAGLYRDANVVSTNTVYHDNYRIGSTYASVAA